MQMGLLRVLRLVIQEENKEGLHQGFWLARRLKREVSTNLLVKQRCKIPGRPDR
jgi:hypothetical protein